MVERKVNYSPTDEGSITYQSPVVGRIMVAGRSRHEGVVFGAGVNQVDQNVVVLPIDDIWLR